LRGRDGFTCGHEFVQLGQELRDSVREFVCGCVALADVDGELSLCLVQLLDPGERFALLDEALFKLVDRALGNRDAACRLGFALFEFCDFFVALVQARVRALQLLLERG